MSQCLDRDTEARDSLHVLHFKKKFTLKLRDATDPDVFAATWKNDDDDDNKLSLRPKTLSLYIGVDVFFHHYCVNYVFFVLNMNKYFFVNKVQLLPRFN